MLRSGPVPKELWRLTKAAAGSLLLAAAILLAGAGATRANPIYTFTLTDTSCGCGTGPFGTVAVTEETGSTQKMDFTVTLNAPYQFHKTTAGPHPMMALNINVTNVAFGNFKLNNTTTSAVTIGGANSNVAGYGTFPYTLKASSNLSGVLTFTASVSTGTLRPTNIVATTQSGGAYLVADIINTMRQTGNTGNVADVNPPVRTPEPASLAVLGMACAGMLFARRRRSAPRDH